MNILLTHGYLLTGTGSNLYVSNLAREFCKAGHNVYLMVQEPNPMEFDYVASASVFNSANDEITVTGEKETPFPGKCHVFQPDIHRKLLVYVYDHYDGFEVKEFPDCSQEELDTYINTNADAMGFILAHNNIDVINTNHTVMFPHIAAIAKGAEQTKRVVTVHGSALNFTVKTDPRFPAYAESGFECAETIVVDSKHAEDELEEFLDHHKLDHLRSKVVLIPAGVDVDSFKTPPEVKSDYINKFCSQIDSKTGSTGRQGFGKEEWFYNEFDSVESIHEAVKEARASYDYRQVDLRVVSKIQSLDFESPTILFIGKYLWTKGLYTILFALPQLLKSHNKAQLIFVGFGPFRENAETLLGLLAAQKYNLLDQMIQSDDELFCNDNGDPLPHLKEIWNYSKEDIQESISTLETDLRDHVRFTGIVAHSELQYLLPCVNILIAPSVFPEAFGMVAIEAMACGVSPILTYQSAFKEIWEEFATAISDHNLDLHKVEMNEKLSQNMAHNVSVLLDHDASLSAQHKSTYQQKLREVVVEGYSWKGIAQKYIEVFEMSS